MLKLVDPFASLLARPLPQRLLKGMVDRQPAGPDEAARTRGSVQLWGAVENASGKRVEATLVTPEGYRLTALTALESTLRVARGAVAPGTQTPATAFGADYVTSFEGCDLRVGAVSAAA